MGSCLIQCVRITEVAGPILVTALKKPVFKRNVYRLCGKCVSSGATKFFVLTQNANRFVGIKSHFLYSEVQYWT